MPAVRGEGSGVEGVSDFDQVRQREASGGVSGMTPEALAALIAENVVRGIRDELERWQAPATGEWVIAKECAARYGRRPRYYLDHKGEFRARPLGDGPRPRWEFNTAEIERVRAERGL
jgi:hypothetical protein